MAVRDILLLGNPALYEVCRPVKKEEVEGLTSVVTDLHDTLLDFRERRGAGRAVAAPQIGAHLRLVYLHLNEPEVLINPVLDLKSNEMMAVWDDCMSFPDLLVRVWRHRTCRIRYRDLDWNERERLLIDDLSELLQHETDHLDGILAVSRAMNGRAFALESQKGFL